MRTNEQDNELALEGRGVKLLLPGGALLIHMPAADGVVLIREAWSAQLADHPADLGGAQVDADRRTIRIEYQDPQGGTLRAFHLPSLHALLAALEPHAVAEGGE